MNTGAGAPSGRLFIALWPSADTRRRLQQWQQQWHWPAQARLTPAQDLHLTLHFIGSVAQPRAAELQAAEGMPASAPALLMTQPALWHAGVAVLLPQQLPDELLQLHAAWQRQLQRLALPVDARPYRPHVTLARAAHGAAWHGAVALPWHSQAVVLAQRDGAHYRVLRSWP